MGTTYRRGGLIDAATFNNFADLMNNVYADRFSVDPAVPANYGYGQTPVVPLVSVGTLVTAADWTKLFGAITKVGSLLQISVAPIPASVTTGALISAYNEYLTTQTLHEVIGNLVAKKFLVATANLSISNFGTNSSVAPWTTGITYTFSVAFTSYNKARYFFNSRGDIRISGSYTPPGSPGPVDIFWKEQLAGMGVIKFSQQWSIPATNGQAGNIGFYNLTSTAQEFYRRSPVSEYVYYSNDFITMTASLSGSTITFVIRLVDNDNSAQTKTGTLAFTIGQTKTPVLTSPAIESPVFNNLGFNTAAKIPYVGPMLNIIPNPLAITGIRDGAGTATSNSCNIRTVGGLNSHPACYVATTAQLSPAPTYTVSGSVGHLTALSNGILQIDGLTIPVLDTDGAPVRVLIKNEVTTRFNGLYEVSSAGSASTKYKLARVADMPQWMATGLAVQTKTSWQGSYSYIQSGTYAGINMEMGTANPTQVGNTPQSWAAFAGSGPYTFNWTYVSGDTVTITTPSAAGTTVSKSLTTGQIAQGQIRCTVTDNIGGSVVSVLIPWSLVSNNINP